MCRKGNIRAALAPCFHAVVEPITDAARIVDFLKLRLRRHRRAMSKLLWLEGIRNPSDRLQLESLAQRLALVAIRFLVVGENTMSETRIGEVVHVFNKIYVAVLSLRDSTSVGDSVRFLGHSTDFQQEVESL